jgi:hypothetical protein
MVPQLGITQAGHVVALYVGLHYPVVCVTAHRQHANRPEGNRNDSETSYGIGIDSVSF